MPRVPSFALAFVPIALLVILGCRSTNEHPDATVGAAPSASTAASTEMGAAPAGASPVASHSATPAPLTPPRAPPAPLSAREFSRLFRELSEPGEDFFSDNTISNETSYLQVAPELARRPHGGAYLGVGPEQNFAYVALTAPDLAFIVDLRRDNALLHLLYRALFERAGSRAEFLASLLGRPYVAAGDPEPDGSVEAIIQHVERQAPDPHHLATVHDAAVRFLTSELGVPLSVADRDHLGRMHRSFYARQLELRFELHEANGRTYPTLRELLSARDLEGAAAGYLGSHTAFARVRELQRANRIIPVVGDFAGEHALRGIAAELASRRLEVTTFYVSNVEQYLLDPERWPRWIANVTSLPSRGDAVFVRAYLDQGRAHPAQLAGHRTATFTQPVVSLLQRQRARPYRTFWQVATEP